MQDFAFVLDEFLYVPAGSFLQLKFSQSVFYLCSYPSTRAAVALCGNKNIT